MARIRRGLKRRIAGRLGHLDNAAAAALLAGLDCSRLQHVVAAHLSAAEQYAGTRPGARLPAPSTARRTGSAIATQAEGSDWLEIRAPLNDGCRFLAARDRRAKKKPAQGRLFLQ